jgi:hypothetical protein
MITPYSRLINEDTKWKLLNLGFNIKENILWSFSLHIFLLKKFNTPQTLFLMLEVKQANSIVKFESSSIKL